MANIETIRTYIDLLPEVYSRASVTAVLDGNNALVRKGANGNILIPSMSMDGLADHTRGGNFVDGNVTLEYKMVAADYDRDRVFNVDRMDDDETAHVAFGQLASVFLRKKAVPEIDAYRFAKYAAAAGNSAVGTLADGAAVLLALQNANSIMDDAEVPFEDRHLFISSAHLTAAENVDTTKSKKILEKFATKNVVPSSRFFTKINLADGKSEGETAGGYAKAADGAAINFMIISQSAVLQYLKHEVSKVISPDENQSGDNWKYFYRAYGYADGIEDNKAGIYLHSEE